MVLFWSRTPFLALHGSGDRLCNPIGSELLYRWSLCLCHLGLHLCHNHLIVQVIIIFATFVIIFFSIIIIIRLGPNSVIICCSGSAERTTRASSSIQALPTRLTTDDVFYSLLPRIMMLQIELFFVLSSSWSSLPCAGRRLRTSAPGWAEGFKSFE